MTNPFPHQLVLGHRGAPREAIENTLRSFDLALRHGADGVELDVQRTRDAVPVVIHDDSLERTMGVPGRVGELDWPAVARLTRAMVPSFDQVAAWAAASGAWLNVELKAAGVEQDVLAILDKADLLERVIVSSFSASIVKRVGELNADVHRFFLTERWDGAAEVKFIESGARGVCLRVDAADESTLDRLMGLELPVIVWTVNEPSTARLLLSAGIAGIITDDPAMVARERTALDRT